jgi:hypothetical protein
MLVAGEEDAPHFTQPMQRCGELNERRDRRQGRPLSYDEEDRVKQFSPPLCRWQISLNFELQMLITLLAENGLRVKKEALPLRRCDVLLDSEPGCIRIL